MDTSRWYRSFAEVEARGNSAIYEEWGLGVSEDPAVLALIDRLPEPRRQPNLIFGASRHLGAPVAPYASFRRWLSENWSEVEQLARTRTTQTNEAGRAAVLLPVLGLLKGPLSLIEVGASAGLCLYPDRYSYLYDGEKYLHPVDGPSTVLLECATTGSPPIPERVPDVVYRAGIDLNPLGVGDTDDMRWLESLVWPEQDHRRWRLRDAAALARVDPPHLVRGDLTSAVADLVERAPLGTTIVVFHSAVLNYLTPTARAEFVHTVRGLPCHWIANEGLGVLPEIDAQLTESPEVRRGKFVVSLDGTPQGLAGGHGQFLGWTNQTCTASD
ncbi:DUF2332 domain-containing protein [Rhodococcus sp. IEGM 1409]|uniref:DUF2332 domain-containing protein n=1 Tax=Rhodococcus sp. IEGM 1409 TaxID=3047082 RepID=UPI0024B7FE4E|nr:DUF2332 domain-containing protein [Rhodococcus sp. IEGM 1409]MDI9902033.1 DUF2332 domain-containing protein [Rhodococcus sp. IEGM 1409]